MNTKSAFRCSSDCRWTLLGTLSATLSRVHMGHFCDLPSIFCNLITPSAWTLPNILWHAFDCGLAILMLFFPQRLMVSHYMFPKSVAAGPRCWGCPRFRALNMVRSSAGRGESKVTSFQRQKLGKGPWWSKEQQQPTPVNQRFVYSDSGNCSPIQGLLDSPPESHCMFCFWGAELDKSSVYYRDWRA